MDQPPLYNHRGIFLRPRLAIVTLLIFMLVPAAQAAVQRTVTFRWNAPTGPAPIDGYVIYWGTASHRYRYSRQMANQLRTFLTLDRNTKYYVTVSAYNKAGVSRLSNEVIVPAAGQGG